MHKVINMHNWISELPEVIRLEVVQRCVKRKLKDGECLYRVADEASECFQVVSGRLKLSTFNLAGQELVYVYLEEGDCLGDYSLILNEKRMNSSFACGDTEVNVLKKSQFDDLYNRYVEIPRAINRVMARRLRFTFMLAEDANLLPLRQRLARAIVRMGYSAGSINADGSATIGDISHDELGKLVGSTRQRVGRELKKLEEEGAIEISYGKLIVKGFESFGVKYDDLIANEPVVPEYKTTDPSTN